MSSSGMHPDYPTRRGRGFTLVELLVVIAIIGALIGLLLPAVQAAREAGRRTACANNIKQLSFACLSHEVGHRTFPTGGTQPATVVGDPDLGFRERQYGGWIFNVLPYIEQSSLRALGAGLSSDEKKPLFAQREQTAIQTVFCPTRRSSALRPFVIGHQPVNAATFTVSAKCDYAANAGDGADAQVTQGTGVIFAESVVRVSQIADGLSKTYLLGEKSLQTDFYDSGESWGDDDTAYWGQNYDSLRVTNLSVPPLRDTPGFDSYNSFGSAHSGGIVMAWCDGAVRQISYAIDPQVHAYLGNRLDGRAASAD